MEGGGWEWGVGGEVASGAQSKSRERGEGDREERDESKRSARAQRVEGAGCDREADVDRHDREAEHDQAHLRL